MKFSIANSCGCSLSGTRLLSFGLVLLMSLQSHSETNENLELGGSPQNASAANSKPQIPRNGEDVFLESISRTEEILKDPMLDPAIRSRLEANLERYKRNLTQHRARRKEHQDAIEALYKQASPTPQPAGPSHSELKAAFDTELERLRADQQLNAQLWENLFQAQRSGEPESIFTAERELAAYLISKLEWIDGKQYPANMPLQDVLRHMRDHPLVAPETGGTSERLRVIRLLIVLASVAGLVALFFLFSRKKPRHFTAES